MYPTEKSWRSYFRYVFDILSLLCNVLKCFVVLFVCDFLFMAGLGLAFTKVWSFGEGVRIDFCSVSVGFFPLHLALIKVFIYMGMARDPICVNWEEYSFTQVRICYENELWFCNLLERNSAKIFVGTIWKRFCL